MLPNIDMLTLCFAGLLLNTVMAVYWWRKWVWAEARIVTLQLDLATAVLRVERLKGELALLRRPPLK